MFTMEYVVDELHFVFEFKGEIYKAYVRVYNTGDRDVEIVNDEFAVGELQGAAEKAAKEKGLF